VLIQIVSWYMRYSEGAAAVLPAGLVLSVVAVVLMLFTGWMGWQMVYRDHVAVSDEADPQDRLGEPIRDISRQVRHRGPSGASRRRDPWTC
jgi:hypothetical protein